MIFKKHNFAHKITYQICGVKITFSKRLTAKAKIVRKKRNIEYKLRKILQHNFKVKKYKYIIPFGMNCDFSIKFLEYFGFNDSTFWNWVWATDVNQQIRLFKNPKLLFSNGKTFIPNGGGMWCCHETNLNFHSKHFYNEMLNENGTLNSKKLEEDYKEIISRMNYLYQKTIKYMQAPEKKLYEYTLMCNDYKNIDQYIERIKLLYEYIQDQSNNFDFLIIVAKQNYKKVQAAFPSNLQNVYVRAVKSTLVDHRQGLVDDNIGWLHIFKEFQPQKIQKSKIKTIKYHQLEINKLN